MTEAAYGGENLVLVLGIVLLTACATGFKSVSMATVQDQKIFIGQTLDSVEAKLGPPDQVLQPPQAARVFALGMKGEKELERIDSEVNWVYKSPNGEYHLTFVEGKLRSIYVKEANKT